MKAGFEGAPVSFLLFVTTLSISFLSYFNFFGKDFFISTTSSRYRPWTVLTTQLCQASISQTVYSLLLIYFFRVLERRWSSQVFFNYHLVVFITTTLFSFLVVRLSGSFLSLVSSHTVFLIYFYLEVLPIMKINFTVFKVSDNVFVYFSYVMIVLNNFKSSPFYIVIGLIAFFITSFKPINTLFVSFSSSKLQKLFQCVNSFQTPFTFVQTDKTQRRQLEGDFLDEMRLAQQNGRQQTTPPQQQNIQPNREQLIQQVMDCGFSREQATFALNNTNNDIEAALAFLLDNANY
ncbi:hypothetical protein EIN_274220 [Entamoeba invadens IP1]|uniref:UBA domain-containing protein n=1 Tax=Entamoeba invadens IP1 TaxID=370355 RepID=A0A0A1U1F3_ENTIV|nr:hypothetical protein EIN_274220 [Entamoeba invadens IP1]ELP87855.1 hypothetical protein EIN_274220 [Entamoeba invadens IP1]|eukprot:XP_004254626.1 hypothetical protein EIN_274220 [Entamoeba invadens IP1]